MSYFDLTPGLAHKLKSMPRGKGATETITNSCNVPYMSLIVDSNSDCFVCTCDGWLPIPVGKVKDFNSLDELWNSPIAKTLQDDVENKKFTWCAVDHCGIKKQNIINQINTISINIDDSCNLHCPSCRRAPIMHLDGDVVESKKKDVERIIQWLDNFERPIRITMSGNGDPLASQITRPLIKSWKPKSTQIFKLLTNGLLIKKQLSDSPILNNIVDLGISVDAGSSEVYENVRLGGSWKILLENFDYVKTINKQHITTLNFAVQKNNFLDMENFVRICCDYGFKGVLHQLDDWGTWSRTPTPTPDSWEINNGTYIDHDVLSKTHVDYLQCKELVSKIKNQNNKNIFFSHRLLQLLEL